MPDSPALPPTVARTIAAFEAMGRDEKMQALVAYSRRLEPLPDRFAALDRAAFTVPECQTRVDLFPEVTDGRIHFYADVNARQSPTIAAFLAIVFAAVNDQPITTTLALPNDLVPRLMRGLQLSAREVGLQALVSRLRRDAAEALAPHTATTPPG
jgi:cysteine desulfuration protein SufE